jgi:hypothetical protein
LAIVPPLTFSFKNTIANVLPLQQSPLKGVNKMTDSNFPAPTLTAPVSAPESLPAPSADDARTTAEKARTLGATVPEGLTPKPVETDEGRVVVMPYAGYNFKVYADNLTGEVWEHMEVGRAAAFTRALIGDNQWALIKGWHMSDIKKFMESLQKLDLLGK